MPISLPVLLPTASAVLRTLCLSLSSFTSEYLHPCLSNPPPLRWCSPCGCPVRRLQPYVPPTLPFCLPLFASSLGTGPAGHALVDISCACLFWLSPLPIGTEWAGPRQRSPCLSLPSLPVLLCPSLSLLVHKSGGSQVGSLSFATTKQQPGTGPKDPLRCGSHFPRK